MVSALVSSRLRLVFGAMMFLAWHVTPLCHAGERNYTQDELMKISFMKSQSKHTEVIEFLERRGALDDLTSQQLHDLCSAYSSVGTFGKMVTCFDKLQHKFSDGHVEMYVTGNIYTDITSTAYTVMARGYVRIRDCERALAAARRAIDSAGGKRDYSTKLSLVMALGELGNAHACQGNTAEMMKVASQIDAIEVDASNGPDAVKAMRVTQDVSLLQLYLTARNYVKALEMLDRSDWRGPATARQWFASNGRQAELDEIETFGEISRGAFRANLLVELGRTEGLKPLYAAALAHPKIQALDSYWSLLFYRGRLAEMEGSGDEAIQYYRQAVEVVERQRSGLGSENAKLHFVGDKQAVYGYLINALVKANRGADAFEYVERAKARALVDMLASREKFDKSATAGEVNTLLATVARTNAEVASFNAEAATPQQVAQHRQTRGNLEAATEQLRKAAPELASLVSISGISEPRLRALLQPDETLVEYYYLGKDLYGFVITANSLRAVRLDGDGLSEAVREFRDAVQNPQSRTLPVRAGRLHARLVAPLGLPAQGKLLVVPHGVLHYLPFNALRDTRGDMIERYSIRMLPSASVLTFLTQRKASGKGLLILGNPDLGNPQYDLPGAQKEATEIARLRPDATLLMRANATKAAVKSEGGKYAYLHFASHGKFNPEQPLQSGLYLAGRETEGMLTVDELYSLNLNADLVTLSACETALGRIDSGDDVIGLTRGFFYAGASSIISSLWPVDDDATYQMMTKFYGELARAPKGEALRTAQLAVKAKYPHPFYWAAFQLTGNAR